MTSSNPTQGIARNLLILRQRIYELSTLIIQQGNSVPSHLITELRSLRASLCELVEVQRLLSPAPSTPQPPPAFSYQTQARPPTVPSQLPFFQWVGHVYNVTVIATVTRTVFPTLNSCVNKFEDVLNTYQLVFNDHWRRLLPLCLPIEIRAWLTDFTTEYTNAFWDNFKAALNLQYGITQDAEQEAATTDLLALHMSRHQTIESFIDQFQDLKRRAGLSEPSVLCPRFVSALPIELSDQVTVALATAPSTTKRNLSFIMGLSKELYNKLYVRNRRVSVTQPSSSNASRIEKRHSGGRSHQQAPARHHRGSSTDTSAVDSQQYCTFHRSYGNHSTDSCRALKATQANSSGSGTSSSPPRGNSSCRRCGAANWSPGHKCNKGKGNAESSSVRFYGAPAPPTANNERTQRAMNLQASSEVNRAQRSSAAASLEAISFVDDDDVEMLDDDDDVEMLDDDISKQCKTKHSLNINSEPSIPSHTHSIFIPITIQDHQTWAYLDTGSNFSAIKPSLVKTLGLVSVRPDFNINNKHHASPDLNKTSFITLGHKNNSIQRVGSIENIKSIW
ncbi:hypothetical protein MFLAVUS_011261 [Mucor flavus]|uniref:Retrotransposon gag domain-containing protein n=1 Tax=Mucor flavus TaxID=439312 RepID=A0ABP9ZF24_9FUNG